MSRRYPKPLKEKLRSLYSWHRWLGIISAVFVIWLAITGLLLQHSHELSLDDRGPWSPRLQAYFGISIAKPDEALQYEGQWLSHVDGRLYFNQRPFDKGPAPVGLTHLGLLWVVACREALWLLNDEAEVIEKIQGLDLPGRILSIGKHDNFLVVETATGNYKANPLSTNWPNWQSTDIPVKPKYGSNTLPEPLKAALMEQARGQALSWERIILDAHSGRLFGNTGVWIMDIMAGTFIVLGISGILLWLRYRRTMRRRRQNLTSS